ncbi:MAG: hypothetical protein ACLQLC_04450 [Candidatus Sulfotelmatobacter sp.]
MTVDKRKAFLALIAHTAFSFIAAVAGGATLYAFFRPVLGRERYDQFAQTPAMIVLLLTGAAVGGAEAYRRWPDRRAFFVWVLPAFWVCHLIVSRGMAAMKGRWSDPLFFLGIGAAYSAGALTAAIVIRKMFQSS